MDQKIGFRISDKKNLLIILLAAVVAVQFVLLLSPSGDSDEKPDGKVLISETSFDSEQNKFLVISFDQPIGQGLTGQPLAEAPAEIYPEIEGKWSWVNPYGLKFTARHPLPVGREYKVTFNDNLLQDDRLSLDNNEVTVATGRFRIDDMQSWFEPAPLGKGQVFVMGRLEFNSWVEPTELIKHLTLTDPLNNRKLPLSVMTNWSDKNLEFRSAPVRKTAQARKLVLTVDAGLSTTEQRASLGEDFVREIEIVLDPNMKVKSIEADSTDDLSTIAVTLSTQVVAEDVSGYVSVSPKSKYSLASSGNELILTGEFKPRQTVTVNLAEGMPAADGALLREDFSSKVRIPDLKPDANFQSQGMFLSRKGLKNLAVRNVNTQAYDMVIDRVYLNNLFSLFNDHGYSVFQPGYYRNNMPRHLGDRLVERKVKVRSKPNRYAETFVNLGKETADFEPGLYRVGLNLPDNYQGHKRWVLLTDIGLVAKKGKDQFLIWATSFSTLKNLGGVKLRLVSDQNQILAQGVTGPNGLWSIEEKGLTLEKDRAYMIIAEKGDDFSFILLDRFQADKLGLDVAGTTFAGRGYTAFMYGERDIYRPGEKMHGAAIVRDFGLNPPPTMPLFLRRIDPRDKVMDTVALTSDASGMVEFDMDIADYALTGRYTLELLVAEDVIGTYSYQVEEFVPDRISVKIDPAGDTAWPGAEMAFDVDSRYLFGPPASTLPVAARVRLAPAPFAPKGHEKYVFGNTDQQFKSLEIMKEDKTLDEQGKAAFSITIPDGLRPPAALTAEITARVSEQGGRGVTAFQGVPVYPYPSYPGLKKLEKSAYSPGEEVLFSYRVVSPKGEDVPSGNLVAEFYQDRWQTVVRRTPSGSFAYESVRDPKLVSSMPLEPGKANGEFKFTPPTFGSFRAVIRDADSGAASQMEFYAGGWGYSPWALENPAKLDLVTDKKEYASGETAVLQIRTPFSGKLLVTVEGENIHSQQILTIGGNTGEVRIPVKAEYSPNVYVTAVLIRKAGDLEPGGTARALGTTPLFVDRQTNRLNVAIDSPELIRPETRLEVAVTAEPGSEVTVAAVDEGILQLIAQETPSPFDHFYAKRGLGVAWYDIFSMLLPETGPISGKSPAGGGMGMGKMKQFMNTSGIRRVKPVSFWSGRVRTDATGKAVVGFDVPQFQGGLRIMAVASNKKMFGSANAMTRVKSPLSLTPTLPRFMSLGETMGMPVTVRNDTPEKGKIEISLAVIGPVQAKQDKMSLDMEAGSEQTVVFDLETEEAQGAAEFKIQASGNGEQAEASVEVGLRAALPGRSLVLAGSVKQEEMEFPLSDEIQFMPATMTREVRVGKLPLIRFSGNLKSLLGYPYGCAEQTISKAFPLLYFPDLAKVLDPETFKGAEPQAMVQAAIQRLRSMQTFDGGFAMWPGGRQANPWVTIYAVHFLTEAKRAGYHVDSEFMLRPAQKFIKGSVRDDSNGDRFNLQRAAYALYALARGGLAQQGNMDYMREKKLKLLSPESRALLAAAYAQIGDLGVFESLTRDLKEEKVKRTTGANLESSTRNLALTLLAFMDGAPGDNRIPTLAEKLAAKLKTERYTTQENGFGLVALGRFFARQDTAPPFSGKVLLDGKEIGTFDSDHPLILTGIKEDKPLKLVMDSGFQPGSLFYNVMTRGVPTRDSYKPVTNGLELERRFLDRHGEPLDMATVKQGDLIVLRTAVKSLVGEVKNAVIQNLLPTGLEIENPRLSSTEALPWMNDAGSEPEHVDLRDDRILVFTDLPKEGWIVHYSLLRAVTAGKFALPPVQAEAMYDPETVASGKAGELEIKSGQ